MQTMIVIKPCLWILSTIEKMPIQKIYFGLWSQEISGLRSRPGRAALSTAVELWVMVGHRAANQKAESVGRELLAGSNFQRPGPQGQTFAIPHHLLKVS